MINLLSGTDFITNLYHIMDCEYFVGGDTGTSHFAAALDPSPPNLIYFMNKQKQDTHALPFYHKNKGKIKYY